MQETPVVVAAGLVDMLENMFDEVQGIIILAIILVAMVFVIMTWMRTRSLVPTLGALVLGALVVWGVNSFGWFANRVGDDVNDWGNRESDVDVEDEIHQADEPGRSGGAGTPGQSPAGG